LAKTQLLFPIRLDDAIDAELQEFMAKRKAEIKNSTGGV
jgi:hypothetical protein